MSADGLANSFLRSAEEFRSLLGDRVVARLIQCGREGRKGFEHYYPKLRVDDVGGGGRTVFYWNEEYSRTRRLERHFSLHANSPSTLNSIKAFAAQGGELLRSVSAATLRSLGVSDETMGFRSALDPRNANIVRWVWAVFEIGWHAPIDSNRSLSRGLPFHSGGNDFVLPYDSHAIKELATSKDVFPPPVRSAIPKSWFKTLPDAFVSDATHFADSSVETCRLLAKSCEGNAKKVAVPRKAQGKRVSKDEEKQRLAILRRLDRFTAKGGTLGEFSRQSGQPINTLKRYRNWRDQRNSRKKNQSLP